LGNADVVIAPTRWMLGQLRDLYGPFLEEEVIPNGRRRTITAESKERLILSAGRLWDEAKNVRALAEIAHCFPWPVYLAGENAHPSGGVAQFKNVTALGRLAFTELARWYARSSIYVMPARYEPFGLSILEAAQARCALVLGDIPSLRENWDGAALFADPDHPEQFREQIERLIATPRALDELGLRAQERAAQLDINTTAEAYLTQYERLLRQSSKMEAPVQ
jgi:glycogen(starch) synthase